MKEQLLRFYVKRADALAREATMLGRRGRYFVMGELGSFLLALVFVVLATTLTGGAWWLVGSAFWLAVYGVVRHCDAANSAHVTQLQHLCRVYEKEKSYQESRFDCFDAGERYVDAHHPFTFDLDIFGPQSLYQRVCRAVTTGGADRLADALSHVGRYNDHREALGELAALEPWRADLMAMGQERVVDTAEILATVRSIGAMTLPRWFGTAWAAALAWASLAGFYGSIVLAVVGVVGARVPIIWGLVQLFLVVGLASRGLKAVSKAVSRLHRQLATYVAIIQHVARAPFRSSELVGLQRQLAGEALRSFTLLGSLIRGIDQRSNEMGIVLFNAFGLMDFFIVRRFLRWKGAYIDRVGEWLDAVSQLDMLTSMATFRYNEPEAVEAQVVSSPTIIYNARELYHPFLSAGAHVGNDFSVADRHFYIITGANMAGKSTFLRSVGINYVLAMNGMPVFAHSLSVSCFGLFTSMRTSDDLAHGISYFNAELLRLKQLRDSTDGAAQPTLIILDEILKGTNSLDKLNGSRLFLEDMSARNVTGIIATHDLELSRMEGDRYHNYCFEIELGEQVSYSYRLTEGVARNQNATFLLKQIIGKMD